MSPEQIYEHLVELAERLQIRVSEKNLRQVGSRARSGLCKVHGEFIYYMDKKADLSDKIALLAECLADRPLEDVYLVPALREVVEAYRSKSAPASETGEKEPVRTRSKNSEVPPGAS